MKPCTSRIPFLLQSSICIPKHRPLYNVSPIATRIFVVRYMSAQSSPVKKEPPISNSFSSSPSFRVSGSTTLNPGQPFDPSLNPPESTRPPPLITPTRGSKQAAPSYYYKLAKVYISFYRAGLRGVWTNWRTASKIRKRMYQAGKLIKTAETDEERRELAMIGPVYTRAEFQVVKRSMYDNKRLPLFLGLFVITFEFFPVVVYVLRNWISDKLPYPCRQPRQVEIVRNKAIERWKQTDEKWKNVDPSKLEMLDFVLYMAEFHDLTVKGIPINWQPWFLLVGRVKKHVEYLRYDDMMIGKDGVKGLIDEEVIISAVERGIWDPDTSMDQLRLRLQKSINQSFQAEKELDRHVKQPK
jgi:hypothetical protein